MVAQPLRLLWLTWTLVFGGVACNGPAPGAHARLGAACASARDCEGLACVADPAAEPADLELLPLICERPMEGAAEGARCETAEDCALGVCVLAGTCGRPCADQTDCGQEERCQEVFARSGPGALQRLATCIPRVSLPEAVEVHSELQREPLPAGDVEIELAASDPDLTTLYVLERDDDLWPETTTCRPGLCVEHLRTRDMPARVLFDAAEDYLEGAPRNPVARGDHVSPAIVALPSGPPDALSEEGYVARLWSEAPGELRVTRIAGRPDRLQLDLNVFYVGDTGLQPEGARGPPYLQDALEVVDAILGQADIFLGEVRQIAVVGELPRRGTLFPHGDAQQGFTHLRLRFGVLAELPGLFRLSAGARNSAVNLFLVSDIEARGGADLQAEAGGIPGPAGMHGTAGSGIAVAVASAGDAERLGRTLAHEIAHFLGLFHVSESDGSVRDPFADTPECRLSQDRDGDGLSTADCADAGADNLMFWATGGGTTLSPSQLDVLRASPVLQ